MNLRIFSNQAVLFSALENNEVKAVLTDFLKGLYYIKQNEIHSLQMVGELIKPEIMAAAFLREDDTFRRFINKGLREIIINGTYIDISLKYFGINLAEKNPLIDYYQNELLIGDESWQCIQRKGVMSLALTEEVPPYNLVNQNDEPSGFDVEIAKAVCNTLGIKFNLVFTKRKNLFNGLKKHDYDGIWHGDLVSEEDKKALCFSNPYYISGLQMFVRKKD